jgi:hypothetical protein
MRVGGLPEAALGMPEAREVLEVLEVLKVLEVLEALKTLETLDMLEALEMVAMTADVGRAKPPRRPRPGVAGVRSRMPVDDPGNSSKPGNFRSPGSSMVNRVSNCSRICRVRWGVACQRDRDRRAVAPAPGHRAPTPVGGPEGSGRAGSAGSAVISRAASPGDRGPARAAAGWR